MTDTLGSRRAATTALGFGALVVLLLANIVITISLDDGSAITRASQVVVSGLALVLVGIGARVPARLSQGMNLVAVVVVVGGVSVVAIGLDERIPATTEVAAAAVYTLAVIGCTIRVLRDERVTIGTLFGALSVYLLLANAFASTFGAIQGITGDPFFTEVGGAASPGDFLYYSLTTLTTLGYGDFTAASSAGRSVSALEAVVGQLFLATFVARTVGAFNRSRQTGGSQGP